MNFYFGMGGTPISLRQKLRMQRERMQCAGLWPVVLNVLNSYDIRKKEIVRMKYTERYRKERKRRKTKKEDPG